MVKKQKIQVVSASNDSKGVLSFEDDLAFKVHLLSQVNEILKAWTMDDSDGQGYENIKRWLHLSREDAAAALKMSKQTKKEGASKQTSAASTYVTLLIKVASNVRKNASNKEKYKKTEILDKCFQYHEYMRKVISDFIEEYSLQKNIKVDSDRNPQREHQPVEDGATLEVATSNKGKRKYELSVKTSAKKKNKKEKIHIEMEEDPDTSDKKEKEFMEALPDLVKQMFREIAFTRWSKDWLPVLVLSPYDVPEGDLRREWMRKYEKHLNSFEAKKVFPMEHLIIWYGCKDPGQLYGWVTDIVTYEDATTKNIHLCPKRLINKIESKKKLTRPEQDIVDGFNEISIANDLSKTERWNRTSDDFPGAEQSVEETFNMEKKVADLESDSENLLVQPIQNKKIPTIQENSKASKTSKVSLKEEKPQDTHDQKNALKKATFIDSVEFDAEESEEEPADDGESFKNEQPKQKKKLEKKEKKKRQKGKELAQHAPVIETKKLSSAKDFISKEETEFYQNEKEILPIMERLSVAIKEKNREAAFLILDEIEVRVGTLAPSFIETHGLGMLIRSTRKTFGEVTEIKTKVKAITNSMKSVYNEKISNRPKNFKQTWKASACNFKHEEIEISTDVMEAASSFPKPVQPPSPTPAEPQIESTGANLCVPRKGGINSETQASTATLPTVEVKASKLKKNKFSLGAMIDGTKQSSSSTASMPHVIKEQKVALIVPSLSNIKKGPPKWLTETLPDNAKDPTVGDEVRSLGKAFIDAIDVDWPDDVLGQIHFESFVHHIEQAIFDWSQEDQASTLKGGRRANMKALKYPENYWTKVRDVVAGLSGDRIFNKPKLVEWMLRGDYETPMDLVKLPGQTFYESNKNLL